MPSDEREGAFKGVSCDKCGLVLETSSKAEMHRLKDHTPKGVQDFFRSISNADALRRGEIKSIGLWHYNT
jgi:hypothetical protein